MRTFPLQQKMKSALGDLGAVCILSADLAFQEADVPHALRERLVFVQSKRLALRQTRSSDLSKGRGAVALSKPLPLFDHTPDGVALRTFRV